MHASAGIAFDNIHVACPEYVCNLPPPLPTDGGATTQAVLGQVARHIVPATTSPLTALEPHKL